MARHTLLFYFLQFLPLLASANAGFNTPLANCIDFDMTNVEELICTLRAVENPEIKVFDSAEEDKEKNQPFGNLKTDWSRLQMLQKALPTDSLLKDKFKHIFRLLLIAHDQATHFLNMSESKKIQDAYVKQTSTSLINNDHTDAEEVKKNQVAENEDLSSKSEEIRAKLKNISTPSSAFDEDVIDTNSKSSSHGLGTIYTKSPASFGDAIEIKGITKESAELGEAKKNNLGTNSVDSDPPTYFSTTIAAPIPTLEAMKSSTSDWISNADATISEEGITIRTSVNEESKQSTANSLSKSTSADEEIISKGQVSKIILGMEPSSSFEDYTSSTTESILKKVNESSSNGAENSPFKTTPKIASTKIQSLASSSSENILLSTTEQPKDKSSLQPAMKVDPVVESSITEKYPSPATVPSIEPTKSQSSVSKSSDKLGTSSSQKSENISRIQTTTDTLLAENFTAGFVEENESILGKTQTQSSLKTESYSSNTQRSSEIRDFDTSDFRRDFTTENTSIGSPKVEENEEIELGISNQGTENSSTTHLMSHEWINVTPTLEDLGIKLTTQKHQNWDPMSEKSDPKILSTIDWIENVSRVTPTIEKNKDNKLASRNDQTETPIDEKSTANLLATKNPIEIISDVPITLEQEKKSGITSPNNETENSTDFVERTSNISPTIENNEDNKLASQNNQTGTLKNEKSTANLSATKNSMEITSGVPITPEKEDKSGITSPNSKTEYSTDYVESISIPTIEKNEYNKLETPINEKSTANLSATKNPMETTSDVPITLEKEKKNGITSANNKTENSTDNIERISNITPTIENNEDNKLASRNNQTEAPINEKSTENLSATKNPMEITSDVPTEQDGKYEITNLQNETQKPVNVTVNNLYTTDSTENTSSVDPKVDKSEDNKLKSKNNQTETLISENSPIDIKETINPSNHVTTITPSINNKTIDSASKNNHKEILASEKSTSSEWSNKDSTENIQITTPTLTMNEETKSITKNDETNFSTNDKSIHKNNEAPSTSTSISALNTSNLLSNTVQFVAGTPVPDVSYKTTQHIVSMEPSITAQEAETSTRNYVSEQSTITTNKIEINIPTDGSTVLTNQTSVSEADFPAENATNNQNNLEIISKKSKDISPEPRYDSENWRTNSKPSFVKNPLNTGSSRSNKIFQDFKHGSGDIGAEKNSESPQIVLYETGAGGKTGSVWRPHLVRQQPAGNNIWRFDGFPNNVGPYGYGYNQPAASSINSKDDIRKDEKNPAKFPGQGSRMNLLRSRKRGSANSDVEKQFRWFYRHGRTDTAHQSREKEKVNSKIKIQCKKAHRR